MKQAHPLLAGVELGGTKCVWLIGTGADDIRACESIPTGAEPELTLRRIEQALRAASARHGAVAALGIASFGPVDLTPGSRTYGQIMATPKPGWSGAPIVASLSRTFETSVGFNTDVNAAALAEGRWGAARGLADFAYITVGTGIGVGLIAGGRLVGGFSHPEWGHVRIARPPGDHFDGVCPFHGDCVEGLASGRAIEARTGRPAASVSEDDPVWERVTHALAQLVHLLVLGMAPRRILLGGGVPTHRPELLAHIRVKLAESLNGYLDLDRLIGSLDSYLVAPGLGPLAGPLGALALAADAL